MRRFTALLLLALSAPAFAVPLQLTHTGRLDDAAGVPLEGEHLLTVSVYADAAGGDALWTDAVTASLQGGVYAIVLGADPANPLPDSALDGTLRYVGLSVDDAPEMSPRLPVTSVPYAVRAGVARDVSGGVVDATEIRINGTTVINAEGAIDAPVAWDDLTGVPAGLAGFGALSCASGEIAIFNGADWACGAQAPAAIDVSTLNGTIDITNLPVGGGPTDVAAGDHAHSFGQITGVAAVGQLPTGSGANEVALGDHGHAIADLSGNLPIARVTGSVPFAQLPTGTAANQVAIGNHGHTAAQVGAVPNPGCSSDLTIAVYDRGAWKCEPLPVNGVTSVAAGAGLSGGTITGTGTIAVANNGITPAMLASDADALAKVTNGRMSITTHGGVRIGNMVLGAWTASIPSTFNGTGYSERRLQIKTALRCDNGGPQGYMWHVEFLGHDYTGNKPFRTVSVGYSQGVYADEIQNLGTTQDYGAIAVTPYCSAADSGGRKYLSFELDNGRGGTNAWHASDLVVNLLHGASGYEKQFTDGFAVTAQRDGARF